MNKLKFMGGLLAGLVLVGVISATSVYTWPWAINQSTNLTNLSVSGDARVQGTLMASGNTQINSELDTVASDVALTSPTVTFSVTNKTFIRLSSDANQTAIRPIDGTTGQIIIIQAAAGLGTNTMQFDDNGATIALGANRTLTEGNFSTLGLLCTAGGSSTASTWCQIFFNAN